jgi:predicted methyltransferase
MNKKEFKEKHKEWYKEQEKLAKEFKLSVTDLHNLYDLLYMIDTPKEINIDLMKTIKMNKMKKWFNNLFWRLEKVCLKRAGDKV